MATFTDWGVVWGSRVVQFKLNDGFMGAVDLRDLSPSREERFALTGDASALGLPDGRTVPADTLRQRCLEPRPPADQGRMRARAFAAWADDGSDVRWELENGAPVAPPFATMGKCRAKTAVLCALMDHLDPLDGPDAPRRWMVLAGTWTCTGADALDCRTPDLVVFPARQITPHSLWVDDPVVIGEIEDAGTAWRTARRLAFARSLPTVREIVVIDWCARRARVERRTDAGWRTEEVASDGVMALGSIDWTVRLADLLGR